MSQLPSRRSGTTGPQAEVAGALFALPFMDLMFARAGQVHRAHHEPNTCR